MRNALVLSVAALLTLASVAQETAKKQPTMVTTTFTVYGNCGKCKKNIERPFKEMQGGRESNVGQKDKAVYDHIRPHRTH